MRRSSSRFPALSLLFLATAGCVGSAPASLGVGAPKVGGLSVEDAVEDLRGPDHGAALAPLGDYDLDGWVDVGSADHGGPFLILGGDAPRFTEQAGTAALGPSSAAGVGPVSGAGSDDLLVGLVPAEGEGALVELWSTLGGTKVERVHTWALPARDGQAPPVAAVGNLNAADGPDLAWGDLANNLVGVVFGGRGRLSDEADLLVLPPGTDGGSFAVDPDLAVSFGAAIAAADLNGDGTMDLLVADPDLHEGAGAVHVWLGPVVMTGAPASWTWSGEAAGEGFGRALAAGDVDGDGFAEVFVGAPGAGEVRVFKGAADSPTEPTDRVSAHGSEGYGAALALLGDTNQDGTVELAVGAPATGGAGRVYVYDTGAAALGEGLLASFDGTREGEAFGAALAGADLNPGTGAFSLVRRADLVVGAPGDGAMDGRILVVPSVADGDGDGATVGACTDVGLWDCDDTNPDVRPGAEELCDGLDNDCDGDVDEGLEDTVPRYLDGDGDGYASDTVTLLDCGEDDGYEQPGGDCDDGADTVFPGAPEVCDGLDNDCDELVDELECGDDTAGETGDTAGPPVNAYFRGGCGCASGGEIDGAGLVLAALALGLARRRR